MKRKTGILLLASNIVMLIGLSGCGSQAATTMVPVAILPSPQPLADCKRNRDSVHTSGGQSLACHQCNCVSPTSELCDVVEMAWQVSKEKGQRSVQWQVPLDQAGWHINSAKPGSVGNVVISGHHQMGSASLHRLRRVQYR